MSESVAWRKTHIFSELLIFEPKPLGWFAILCKEAVNPHLPKNQRKRTRALLELTQGKRRFYRRTSF